MLFATLDLVSLYIRGSVFALQECDDLHRRELAQLSGAALSPENLTLRRLYFSQDNGFASESLVRAYHGDSAA
jgi:hypothetical protein